MPHQTHAERIRGEHIEMPAVDRRDHAGRQVLLSRIQNEFEEMPGTCVTVAQAGRLFGIPLDATTRIFSQLIEDGVLQLTPDGRYRRATNA
jgi:Fic family protein